MSTDTTHIAVIIPTAGKGARMGADQNKLFLDIEGISVLERTLSIFISHPAITDICLVTTVQERDFIMELAQATLDRKQLDGRTIRLHFAVGGDTRRESVHNGLNTLAATPFKVSGREIVMVHDGARCFVDHPTIDRCIFQANVSGACVAAVPVKDTIKQVDKDKLIISTLDRDLLWQVQTPQAFFFDLLLEAYQKGPAHATDDASLVEALGHDVRIVQGSDFNIKITTPEDLIIGRAIATHPR
ncbi:MAG: 2-C-methyl-D-erythritol 4-phosphate cytidylyltransferase [Fastidiosipilaceae bacterium]